MASSPRFVSIRWKLWVPFLLVVLSVHWGLYGYFSLQFERQYNRDRQISLKSNLKTLDGVLTASYHKLLEVGHTILLMKPIVSTTSYQEFIHSVIKEKFPQFEAQGILDGAAVFDSQGRQVFSAGNIDMKSASGVLSALKNEHPVREMGCDKQCFRTIAIPLLNAGKVEGVLVLGRLMQDMVLDFKQLTAVEMGIAKKNLERQPDIEGWSLDFTQLTQRNRNIQILQALSHETEQISNEALYKLDVFDRHFEIYFTVPESVALTDTVWVLIADSTLRYQALQVLKYQLAAGLLISSLFLLFITFMSTLKTARRVIKVALFSKEQCLATERSAFSHIDTREKAVSFPDEIADIYRSIKRFGDKVALLYEREDEANQRIEKMANALRMEKEVVAHLMGRSENVIVTQSMDGVVLTINDVGKKVFSITKGEASSRFSDLFFAGEFNHKAVDQLNRLYMGLETLVCSDSQGLDLKGQLRYFLWIHSCLPDCPELRPIILSIGMDVTEKREAEKRLSWLVLHDPVTKVPNKQFFLQQLTEIMEECQRNQHSLAVLCCDVAGLHHSSQLVGIFEHSPELTADVAQRISNCLRGDDIVVRFDDELFMVVLKSVKNSSGVERVAQKIITAFSTPFDSCDGPSAIGINIGISIFPDQAVGVAEVVSRAEIAMHMSLDHGVNNYQYYRHPESGIKGSDSKEHGDERADSERHLLEG